MGLLASLIAACTGASAQWSRQSPTQVALDGVAQIMLPKGLKLLERTTRTPDYLEYNFEKVNDTHINGTTSYAEEMVVVLFAPDFPRERFDADLANGLITFIGRSPGAGDPGANGLRWKVREIVYDRHPVKEPSWQIRVDNRERGIVVNWRGFKKTYTLEQAKSNLTELIEKMSVSNSLLADFQTRRSWAPSGWEKAYAANLAVAKAVLAEKQLSLAATDSLAIKGQWRLYVDSERPQQLHVIHQLAVLKVPEAPFRTNAPVTFYKYMQERWFQENQGTQSDMLPLKGQAAIAPQHTDREKIYFYQMQAVDLWKTYASDKEFGDMLRALLKKMETDHTRLLRDGFIDGDAEP